MFWSAFSAFEFLNLKLSLIRDILHIRGLSHYQLLAYSAWKDFILVLLLDFTSSIQLSLKVFIGFVDKQAIATRFSLQMFFK